MSSPPEGGSRRAERAGTAGRATAALHAAFDAAGVPLARLRVDDPVLRRQCAADLVLVRPDQHVAWRGASADRRTADAIVTRVTGREQG